jgi:DUF917 family protein
MDQVHSTRLSTVKDCEDLLVGSTWLATGGGGGLEEALADLKVALEEGLPLGWVPLDSVPDDVWTVTVGVHGTIVPPSKETLEELSSRGMKSSGTNAWVAESIKELAAYLGCDFGGLVTTEMGPGAIADALTVGARLGIPVVDGDYAGRAVPEELQTTYCLYEKLRLLFASADPWGNVAIVKRTVDVHMLERMAKMLSVASYGAVAVAVAPLSAGDMKEIVVQHTLSVCLEIGRALRHARETRQDPIDAALMTAGGWRLFEGDVVGFDIENRDGYGYGRTEVQGTGAYQGQKLAVWFKNENQVSWLNGNPWICSPDILTLVYKKDGRGPLNSEIKVGDQLVAIGIRGLEGFRTQRGMELAGPGHFGFDVDYVPIEELMAVG